mgnify:CR=1 FL=1
MNTTDRKLVSSMLKESASVLTNYYQENSLHNYFYSSLISKNLKIKK